MHVYLRKDYKELLMKSYLTMYLTYAAAKNRPVLKTLTVLLKDRGVDPSPGLDNSS